MSDETSGGMPPDSPPPELTRLRMDVHVADDGSRSLEVSFVVNIQQTLDPMFDQACWDAILRHAHAAGHLPIGPILVRQEKFDWRSEMGEGTPTDPVARTMEELSLKVSAVNGDIVKVVGDVELGLSL